MAPGRVSVSHLYSSCYILSFTILFTTLQIRQEYARYLEEHHMVEILMWSLFKLMPTNPDKMFDITPDMSVNGMIFT